MRTCCFATILLLLGGCKRAAEVPALPEVPPDAATLPMEYRDHNLVFVSFDALQAAHVGCLGHNRNTTPTIDSLAAEGFLFPRAYSVASWTVPASMSWFTGVYPSEHRMTNKFAVFAPPVRKTANLRELSPGLVTLADMFRQNGYVTGGFTGNAGVSGGFGYEQGFDVYVHDDGVFGGFDDSAPRALTWLRGLGGKKFFLFLHGYDVHGQSEPKAGYDYRFVERDYDKRYTGSSREQEALREEGLARGSVAMRDADVQFWRAVYDEKVQRADRRFRRFLDEFEKLGLMEKTLFVVTSDHGTELHEHGRFDHGFTLYDELLRVPLVVKLPGQKSGKRVVERISSIDLMPTVVELMGLSAPKAIRGTSLVAAMRGGSARRDVFAETDYRAYTYKRAVITPDGWKLVYTLESKRRELYDLNADPSEQRDLAAAETGRADELERKLFRHFSAIGHDLGLRRWEIGLNPVYRSQEK